MQRAGLILILVLLVGSCTEAEEAPFDAVMVELFGTTDLDEYLSSRREVAGSLLVECMNDAGFEFVIEPTSPSEPTESELSTRTFAETKGFGIVSGFRDRIAQAELAGLGGDPNAAYLRTLTVGEIERFFRTLDGEPASAPGQEPEIPGCRVGAADAAYADWTRFYEALPNYTALGEERDTHPGWLAARADWRACMEVRGFDYAEPDAIRADVRSRLQSSVEEEHPGGRLPLIVDDGQLIADPAVEPLLDRLQRSEIAAAVANLDCAEPLQRRFDAVEAEVQRDFVARNHDVIDELRDR